jgi:hypothetical protein
MARVLLNHTNLGGACEDPNAQTRLRSSVFLPFVLCSTYETLRGSCQKLQISFAHGIEITRKNIDHVPSRPDTEKASTIFILGGGQKAGHEGFARVASRCLDFVRGKSQDPFLFLPRVLGGGGPHAGFGMSAWARYGRAHPTWLPRVLLYDNLKSAVLERQGQAIRFHLTLLEFAVL